MVTATRNVNGTATVTPKMTARVEGDKLIIEMPLGTPTPSSTGKTLVIASSHGNKTFDDVLVNGKPLTIGVNAYIKK